jgi:hypothetical protein
VKNYYDIDARSNKKNVQYGDTLFQVAEGNAPKCDKTPRGQDTYKTPGENPFTK